jgi:hypothetical protein
MSSRGGYGVASDPWAELAARPDLLLVRAPIAERGRYYHGRRAIVLRTGLLLVEERATLWHELVHAERGDEPCDRWDDRQEGRCTREAARRAIGVRDLADALVWSSCEHEVADELKTTTELLRARLEHLHPAERGYLRRRLEAREGAA